MKNLIYLVFSLCFLTLFIGCKEQVADDSACPNCPVITKITPEIGQEGNEITIVGQRFGTDKSKVTIEILTEPNKVIIGTNDITSISDSEIKFKVPAGKSGTGKVLLKINLGTDILSSDDAGITNKPADVMFTFQGKASFTISSLNGKVGDELSIKGDNFGTKKEDITLKIGTIAIPINSVTDKEIKFTVPKGVPAKDKITVTVSGFTVAGILDFIYNIPKITNTSISGAKDETITIQGDFFTTNKGEIKAFIGTAEVLASNIISSTDKEIKIKIAKGTPSGRFKVKIYDFESIDAVDFDYNYTVSTTTLFKTTEIGGWAIDPVDESIYFMVSKVCNACHTVYVRKLNITTKTFTDVFTGTFSQITPNYKLILAYSGMAFIPYNKTFNPPTTGIIQLGLEPKLGAGWGVGASPQAGILENPNGIPSSINGRITSIGLENRSVMYVVNSDATNVNNTLYKIETSAVFWLAPFNKQTQISPQFLAIANPTYLNSKIYIPVAGGIMTYDSPTQKLEQFVGSKTANPYNSVDKKGDGEALSALLNNPKGITIGPNETFLIADTDNSLIRMAYKKPDNKYYVKTIAGKIGQAGSVDGSSPTFQQPHLIFTTKSGLIYIIDNDNKSVRTMTLE